VGDERKKQILFLCTGNAARSQMAEALARIDQGDRIAPWSAGSRPAGFVHPLAIRAVEELGFHMDGARSKGADEVGEQHFDLVVTVCDSAAADCPSWPNARHVIHWSVEDPSFLPGTEEERLAAFRATRDELRGRIDRLVEALWRTQPRRGDAEILSQGAPIVEDVLRTHGFKPLHPRGKPPSAARAVFRRRTRALELEVRSGVAIATFVDGEHRLPHPDYMERLGAADAMRYPGLSRDPLEPFRRLRADLARFGEPFLTGRGGKEFRRWAEQKAGTAARARR
jgi:arsenate reductase (thioredoxin)